MSDFSKKAKTIPSIRRIPVDLREKVELCDNLHPLYEHVAHVRILKGSQSEAYSASEFCLLPDEVVKDAIVSVELCDNRCQGKH